VEDDEIVFAGHAERYSRVKNDPHLNAGLLAEALSYGRPDAIAWNGSPLLRKLRQVVSGQWDRARDLRAFPRRYLSSFALGAARPPVHVVGHHAAHAAAGFYTSPFQDAVVITADAIGEFDTFSIHHVRGRQWRTLSRVRYPDSLGLLYSAFTRRCGLAPNKDEYIVMALAALGRPRYVPEIERSFISTTNWPFELRANVHRGIGDWLPEASREDLAASIQAVLETVMLRATRWARERTGERNLVLMGGVALNCVANTRIAEQAGYDDIWIMPNPGDAGSSLGAALALARRHVRWRGPYLGTDINRPLDVGSAVSALEAGRAIGLANGRAEFGPRALGNRSVLADARVAVAKDLVNQLKRREPFRPFAPVVLEQHAPDYFELPRPASPYMQYTLHCRRPDDVPAVVHVDGTSRVQTLAATDRTGLHALLTAFHARTGCPVLLNTSMNVRDEPLVNTWADAQRFSADTGIEVF
jgi:carbamoyltransferase